jgi:hypothetical protein
LASESVEELHQQVQVEMAQALIASITPSRGERLSRSWRGSFVAGFDMTGM